MRQVYNDQRFVCFVGPQNAGKSTLLNNLYGTNAVVGSRVHTAVMATYPIKENVFAVDFPGSNSLDEDHRLYFNEFGHLANLFVFVVPYNGTADEFLVENVKSAYEKQRQAGRLSKTIFCLNKCGNPEHDGEIFDETYKQEFLNKIRADIANRDFKKEDGAVKKIAARVTEEVGKSQVEEICNEIIAVSDELKKYTMDALGTGDFIFTDWCKEDPERGIYGPNEVKKRIDDYVNDSRISGQ